MDLSAQKSMRVGGEKDSGGSGVWSPDGKWIAFKGQQGDKGGLFVVRLDGSEVTMLTNQRLVPFEAAQHVAYPYDRPRALHRVSLCGLILV
jgi:Tol biopolymer transport system component